MCDSYYTTIGTRLRVDGNDKSRAVFDLSRPKARRRICTIRSGWRLFHDIDKQWRNYWERGDFADILPPPTPGALFFFFKYINIINFRFFSFKLMNRISNQLLLSAVVKPVKSLSV